jgi:photosystem II stability/assembly factor-like uncharacterized protein
MHGVNRPKEAGGLASLRRALTMVWLLVPALSVAQGTTWTATGPDGGDVRAFAVDRQAAGTVYVGIENGGLFRSADGGVTWGAVGAAALGQSGIRAIAVAPSNGSVLYVATERAGVFRSADRGASWSPASTGLPSSGASAPVANALAVDPADPLRMWAGLGGNTFTGQPRLYRSIDGGASWTVTGPAELADTSINALTTGPGSPPALLAGTSGKGVWSSVDGGLTWAKEGDAGLDGYEVYDVDLDTATGSAAPGEGSAAARLSWRSLAASSGGLFHDPGSLWKWLSDLLNYSYPRQLLLILEEFAGAPGALRAGTSRYYVGTLAGGVFRSNDAGATWATVNSGLPSRSVSALAQPDASAPDTVLAGTEGAGVYRTTSGGASWTRTSAGVAAASVSALAVAPDSPATVYAGTRGGGVLKSVDGGASWAPAAVADLVYRDFDPWVGSLAIDPNAPATLYLASNNGVFKSTAAGASWSRLTPPAALSVSQVVAIEPGGIAVWAGGFNGIARSTDGGATWTLPTDGFSKRVLSLAFDPAAAQTVYAGTDGTGVWKSSNGGMSWVEVNNDGGAGWVRSGRIATLAVDPAHPGTIYAGVDGRAVWKSTDGGGSWSPVTQGLVDPATLAYATPTALAFDPHDPTALYLTVADSLFSSGAGGLAGVYRTTDGGASWSRFGDGLTGRALLSLLVDPSAAGRLYVGSQGAGAFRLGPPASRLRAPRRKLDRG